MKNLVFSSLVAASAVGFGLIFAGSAQAKVKLGVAGPMTGPSAETGVQMANGVRQAAKDINQAGGILGQKIAVEVGDDASKPEEGVSVAKEFAGDRVKFVVGDYNSAVSIPASNVYHDNGILQITPASTNPTFTERGLWNVFRACGRADQQGLVAAAYVAKHFVGKRIAIIHDKTTYGKGLADEMRKAMNARGLHEVLYQGINVGENKNSAIVAKIKAVHADLVYFGGLPTEGGLLIRQMRAHGVNATMMGGDGLASEEFAAIGDKGVEGTLTTFGPDPTTRPQAAAIVKEFKAKKFIPEAAYALYSYAAVQIIKQAAERAKSLDPEKVAALMHSGVPFHTVIGRIAFDKKGDRTKPDFVIYKWVTAPDGKLTFVQQTSK